MTNELAHQALALYKGICRARRRVEQTVLRGEIESYNARLARFLGEYERAAGELLRPPLARAHTIASHLDSLVEDLNQPFTLFLVGLGNIGKSTLINALLGGNFAPVDSVPKTWKIDLYCGELLDSPVRLRLSDGTTKSMGRDEALAFLDQEEDRQAKSEEEIEKRCADERAALKTVEEREEFRAAMVKRFLYESPVVEVIWPCGSNALLDRFRLVDTPGLSQDVAGQECYRDLREYYHKADGVLWLLDATVVSAGQPKKLLAELESTLAKVGGKADNILGVLNRIDLVRAGDASAERRVTEEAQRLFAGYFLDIIPVSAAEALTAVETGDAALYERSGLPLLKAAIEGHFVEHAYDTRYASKNRGFVGYRHDVASLLGRYRERLEKDEACRARLDKDFRDIVQSADQVRQRLDQILQQYRHKVDQSIENNASKVFNFGKGEDDQRIAFIRETILCRSDLNERLQAFKQDVKVSLFDSLALQAEISQFKEFPHLKKAMAGLSLDLDIEVSASDVTDQIGSAYRFFQESAEEAFDPEQSSGFIVTLLNLIGGTASALISAAIALFKLPKVKTELRRQMENMIRSTRGTMLKSLEEGLAEVSDRVSAIRENSFAGLHISSERIPNLVAAMSQLEDLRFKPVERTHAATIIRGGR